MTSDDEVVTVKYTPSRIGSQKEGEVKAYMKEQDSIQLRLTRIRLEGGGEEYLLSDLEEGFTKEDLDEIYAKRWIEETAFRTIKNSLKMENFSGVTPRLIEQDVYSTLYISNLIQDGWQYAQQQIDQGR